MSQLRIILGFDGQTMMWDESTIKMKEYEDLLDIHSPINEFYWHEESYESQALNDASANLKVVQMTVMAFVCKCTSSFGL
jgi:hypothetical protein